MAEQQEQHARRQEQVVGGRQAETLDDVVDAEQMVVDQPFD
jgi:hypothetical protein